MQPFRQKSPFVRIQQSVFTFADEELPNDDVTQRKWYLNKRKNALVLPSKERNLNTKRVPLLGPPCIYDNSTPITSLAINKATCWMAELKFKQSWLDWSFRGQQRAVTPHCWRGHWQSVWSELHPNCLNNYVKRKMPTTVKISCSLNVTVIHNQQTLNCLDEASSWRTRFVL